MKLHFIYLFIGISTLALNIILTLHIIWSRVRVSNKEIQQCDDVITFRLTSEESAEDVPTATVSCDDTVLL